MTVPATESYSGPYAPDGVVTAFPFTFTVGSDTELVVIIDGDEQDPGDYTVTLNAGNEGGTVNYLVAPTGTELFIASNPSFAQEISFQNSGPFHAETIDEGLDRSAVRDIYLFNQLSRAIRLPLGEELAELPPRSTRSLMILGFDASGDLVLWDQAGLGFGIPSVVDETELAASSGAGMVGFIQSGTGAILRTMLSKGRDVINAKDFGVLADGVTDDKAALQLAINAAGVAKAEVRLPRGTIIVSGTLNMNAQAITLKGEGPFATRIECTALNTTVIAVTADHCRIEGLSTKHNGGTPVNGAVAISVNANHFTGQDIMIRNAYDGVVCFGSSNVRFRGLTVLDYENTAFWARDAALDTFVSQFYFNCGTSTRGALGAIRLQNQVEAANFTDGEILQGVYSLTTAAVTNGPGTRPAYAKFTNIYFDSSAQGGLIDKVAEIEFHNCWFSNRPNNGIVLNNCDGVRFFGGGALNCGQRGVLVNNTAVRTVFKGFTARGNSQATANTYDGIVIAAGTTDFIIQGCTVGGSLGFGSQRWGILVNTGASDRYIVADNLVTGNTTGGVSDNGTGVNKRVANNY